MLLLSVSGDFSLLLQNKKKRRKSVEKGKSCHRAIFHHHSIFLFAKCAFCRTFAHGMERCVPAVTGPDRKGQAEVRRSRRENSLCEKWNARVQELVESKECMKTERKKKKKLSTFQEFKYRNIHTNVASHYMIVGDIEIFEALTL